MADAGYPPPGGSPADRRPLQPGGGRRLRRAYLIVAILAVLVLVGILPSLWYASVASEAWGNLALQLVATAVLALSSGFAIAAAGRGRAAIRGDTALVPVVRASGTLARAGGLIGWAGAPVIVAIGLVQHLRQAELGLLQGVVFGGVAMLPALLNDGVRRMARLVTG